MLIEWVKPGDGEVVLLFIGSTIEEQISALEITKWTLERQGAGDYAVKTVVPSLFVDKILSACVVTR